MWKRGPAVLVCLCLLTATGVASGTPCCTLAHLAERASVASPDCCDKPDCCRGETRGPADATLTIKPPEIEAAVLLAFGHPLLAGETVTVSRADRARIFFYQTDLPPPLDGRGTHLRISVFRV